MSQKTHAHHVSLCFINNDGEAAYECVFTWRVKLMPAFEMLVYISFPRETLADKVFWHLCGLST